MSGGVGDRIPAPRRAIHLHCHPAKAKPRQGQWSNYFSFILPSSERGGGVHGRRLSRKIRSLVSMYKLLVQIRSVFIFGPTLVSRGLGPRANIITDLFQQSPLHPSLKHQNSQLAVWECASVDNCSQSRRTVSCSSRCPPSGASDPASPEFHPPARSTTRSAKLLGFPGIVFGFRKNWNSEF